MSFSRKLQRQQEALKQTTRERARIGRRTVTCGAALAVALGTMTPAAIAAVEPDELDLNIEGVKLMSRAELDNARGGFAIGPFFVNFGMKITTTVDNLVTFTTTLTMDPQTDVATINSTASAAAAGSGAGAGAGSGYGSGAGAGAGSGYGSAASGATVVAAPGAQVGVTLPQIIIGSVADDKSLSGGQTANSGGGDFETGGATSSIPIPVAGEIIGEIQDAVGDSALGDMLPAPSNPDANNGQPVTTPQQLADLITGGAPNQETSQTFTGQQADAIVNQLPDTSQYADSIIQTLPPTDDLATSTTQQNSTSTQTAANTAGAGAGVGVGSGAGSGAGAGAGASTSTTDVASLDVDAQSLDNLGDYTGAGVGPQHENANVTPSDGAVDPVSEVQVINLPGGAQFSIGGTTVRHQLQNGITAAVQNSAPGTTVNQTVELSFLIENFTPLMQGALANMKAAIAAGEIARAAGAAH